MVAVKVRNEYMTDLMKTDARFEQLHLGALAAIQQKVTVLNLNELTGWKPAVGRQGSIRT